MMELLTVANLVEYLVQKMAGKLEQRKVGLWANLMADKMVVNLALTKVGMLAALMVVQLVV